MADTANSVYRDFVTDGVPASGAHDPYKPEIRRLLTGYEQIINAFTSNGGLIYASREALYADLNKAANAMAWVLGDATVAYNGVYRKNGTSGSGSWTRVADLPFSFIIASDVGAGTANAIQATTSLPVSSSALVWMNVFEANTASPVTVSFNGGAALTIKTNSGNNPVQGGLVAGMVLLGVVSGSDFRLVSDQASASIVAAAEAWANIAQAAANGSLAFPTRVAAVAATIDSSVTSITLRGEVSEGDGLGGLFIDTNNGNTDTFPSADGRTWYRVFVTKRGSVNALEFGVSIAGISDQWSRLQPAITKSAQLGLKLIIPAGLFPLSQELLIPDGSNIDGRGYDKTILRLMNTANVNQNVLTNENNANRNSNALGNKNIRITNLQGDGNVERLAVVTATKSHTPGTIGARQRVTTTIAVAGSTVAGRRVDARFTVQHSALSLQAVVTTDGTVTVSFLNTGDVPITIGAGTLTVRRYDYDFTVGPTSGSAFCFKSCEFLTLKGVKGVNAAKHACDISANEYYIGTGDTEAAYPPAPSRFIWVNDCEWSGGGDDNFTTHASEWVWISDNYSHDAGRTYIPTNSNCYEIDECSRHIWLTNCKGVNASNGLEIKGHSTTPAACDVHVTNLQISFCDVGIDLHHTSHGDSGQPVSPTGKAVRIINPVIRFCTGQYFRCLSYDDVVVENMILEDDGTNTNIKPFAVENGARNVRIINPTMTGFAAHGFGFFVQSDTTVNVTLSGGRIEGGTDDGIFIGTGVKQFSVRDTRIVKKSSASDVFGIDSGSHLDSSDTQLENVYFEGYGSDQVRAGGILLPALQRFTSGGYRGSGNLHWGNRNSGAMDTQTTLSGFTYIEGGQFSMARNGGTVLSLNRLTSTGGIMGFQSAGVNVGSISVTGSGTAFNQTSDKTLKEDLGELTFEDARNVLDLIAFHKFTWNERSGASGVTDEGVFAQELYEVYPKAVTPGGWFREDDKDNEVRCAEGDKGAFYLPWQVDYSKLVTVIGRCVQGVMRRQDDFEARLVALGG